MKYLLWSVKLAGWHRGLEDGIQHITSHLDMAGRFNVDEAVAFQQEHPETAVFPDVEGAAVASNTGGAALSGVCQVMLERSRQENEEGWTPEHDDQHVSGELNDAALAYAYASALQSRGETLRYILGLDGSGDLPKPWPWGAYWWKPSEDPIRNLVKAGALICAEIDRLERMKY
jgi:hypothetical protein